MTIILLSNNSSKINSNKLILAWVAGAWGRGLGEGEGFGEIGKKNAS